MFQQQELLLRWEAFNFFNAVGKPSMLLYDTELS